MDASLVKDIILEIIISFIRRNIDFDEPIHLEIAQFLQQLFFLKILLEIKCSVSKSLNQSISLSWSKTTEELHLIVEVIMLAQQVDVDTNFVYSLDVDLFECIS